MLPRKPVEPGQTSKGLAHWDNKDFGAWARAGMGNPRVFVAWPVPSLWHRTKTSGRGLRLGQQLPFAFRLCPHTTWPYLGLRSRGVPEKFFSQRAAKAPDALQLLDAAPELGVPPGHHTSVGPDGSEGIQSRLDAPRCGASTRIEMFRKPW